MFSDFVRANIIFWGLICLWFLFGGSAPEIVQVEPDYEITPIDEVP